MDYLILAKYNINVDYFKSIDSEEKAYWLGFIYADGNVFVKKGKTTPSQFSLTSSLTDIKHLDKFRKAIEYNKPLDIVSVERNGRSYNWVRVLVYNTAFIENVAKYIKPNKTSINQPPPITSFQDHFWAGVFDGDGSIYFDKSNNCTALNLTGSHSCVSDFKTYFSLSNKIVKYNNYSTITVSKGSNVENICRKLYSTNCIRLERKQNKARGAF